MTTQNVNIHLHHVTRVEGHGNIVVNVKHGKIEKCEWQVSEAPRFFEAMVRGRHYTEVARITSRICGICAVGHTLASVKATEDALGIRVSEQTQQLRKIIKLAENYDSHIVHVLFLVAPDLFGAPSVFPLVKTHPEVVKRALRLKRYGHEWGSLIGGRTTHPTRIVPGGFAELPTQEELSNLRKRFDNEFLPDINAMLEVIASVADKIPTFERPTEYVSLTSDTEYALYDGEVKCTLYNGDSVVYPVKDYKKVTNEWVSPLSTAKYTKHRLNSYAAGALARFNNNYDKLHPEAQKLAKALGMQPICTKPYYNNVAQVVEIVHSLYYTMEILDKILAKGIKEESLVLPTKYGEGFGSVEVPRGILFHHYFYDKDYMCLGGNCIIPTNQNHANIQLDFEQLLPELLKKDKTEKEIELAMEMLVRAYDPCISCSTHYLDVKFVR